MIASKIGGVTSNVNLKKTLGDAGLLKYNKDGEYSVKVKLAGTNLQEHYTTVSVDLLTEQAKELLPSAFATFLQCTDADDEKRIRLGHDEFGRGIYWSINHKNMLNQTMLVTGSPNCGQSSFIFQLAQSALKIGECIIYIDYNHSCTI